MKTGIIGAERQEVDLLFAALAESGKPVRVTVRGPLEFHEGTLRGAEVVVVCCGIGKVNAALCAQMLVSEFSVGAVINTGSAGGLAPGLSVFDMVVSTEAVQHDFDLTAFGYRPGQVPGSASPCFAADAGLRNAALAAWARSPGHGNSKMIEGRVASGDVFITDKTGRDRVVSVFSPACVEMEGAAIAQVCALNGVPFVILRSISDLAGENAGVSYEEFSRQAAQVSARIVIEMVAGSRPA